MEFFSKGCVKLKRYLVKAELGQKEFADAANIQPDFLSHLLKGRKRPSVDTAYRIKEASRGEIPMELWAVEAKPRT